MNVLYCIFAGFSLSLEMSGLQSNTKERFPFKNYYIVSTYIPMLDGNSSREKRQADPDNCIDFYLSFSSNSYKMCIQKYNISESNLVNGNTQFIIYKNHSKDIYKLDKINIKFVKGYIVTKPYTSSFNGYISNNSIYGKMEIDLKSYYIEPLDNFEYLSEENGTTLNAIVYEVSLNDNIAPLYYENNAQGQAGTIRNGRYSRSKRKINNTKTVKGRICSLLILIDNSFLRLIGKNNVKLAITTVLHSLDVANSIFRITDFNNDGIPDNIGFMTKYIIVLQSESIGMNKLPKYTKEPLDGRLYLYFLSRYELLKEVCLGIAFTAQPFLHRALGLSYTAITQTQNLSNPNAGGICERPSPLYFGESFNNLVVTYRLEQEETVPQITTDLSLAHELGHSFGSDHDEVPKCHGYLMSPHTFNGTYDHNFKFSSCSKRQIAKVLKEKGHCLKISSVPFCGNGLVEANEDCDCGYPFHCVRKDPCCIARNTKGPSCKVNKKAGFDCHPSQGICCLSNCYYLDLSHLGLSCKNFDKGCPCSISNTKCLCGIFGSCVKNQCHSLECTRINMTECRCSNQKKEQTCITCCRKSNGKCYPATFQTDIFISGNEKNIDILKQHSVKNVNVFKNNTATYKKFCVDGKCVVLEFRTFNTNSLCLYKSELGTCRGNKCVVTTVIKPQFPNFKSPNSSFSGCFYQEHMYTMIISLISSLLCY